MRLTVELVDDAIGGRVAVWLEGDEVCTLLLLRGAPVGEQLAAEIREITRAAVRSGGWSHAEGGSEQHTDVRLVDATPSGRRVHPDVGTGCLLIQRGGVVDEEYAADTLAVMRLAVDSGDWERGHRDLS